MKKDICIIGAGKQAIEISVKKAMSIHGDCFIRLHNGQFRIIDHARILESNIQKEKITIMKGASCGMTQFFIDYGKPHFSEIKIKNIKLQFVPDYVTKSLKELNA